MVRQAAQELQAAVEAFCYYIEDLGPVRPKAWGPREVLAHLTFWQQSYVNQAEALIARRAPPLPHGTFDELNARAAAASRSKPMQDLLATFRAVNRHLTTIVLRPDADQMIMKLKSDSRHYHPMVWLVRAEAGHVRQHLHDLQHPLDPVVVSDKLHQQAIALRREIVAVPMAFTALARLVATLDYYAAQLETRAPSSRPDEATRRGQSMGTLLTGFDKAIEVLCQAVLVRDPQDTLLKIYSGQAVHRFTLDYALTRVTGHLRRLQRKLPQ